MALLVNGWNALHETLDRYAGKSKVEVKRSDEGTRVRLPVLTRVCFGVFCVADKRSTNWFLMGSPFTTAAICLSYVYIVKVLGPRLMENRKPFSLRKVLIYYNLFQVLFSTWLFYEVSGDISLADRS